MESNAKHSFQLLGQKNVGQKTLKPRKFGLKSLVKIRSVTAEIFLIWTNVTLTKVASMDLNVLSVMVRATLLHNLLLFSLVSSLRAVVC